MREPAQGKSTRTFPQCVSDGHRCGQDNAHRILPAKLSADYRYILRRNKLNHVRAPCYPLGSRFAAFVAYFSGVPSRMREPRPLPRGCGQPGAGEDRLWRCSRSALRADATFAIVCCVPEHPSAAPPPRRLRSQATGPVLGCDPRAGVRSRPRRFLPGTSNGQSRLDVAPNTCATAPAGITARRILGARDTCTGRCPTAVNPTGSHTAAVPLGHCVHVFQLM